MTSASPSWPGTALGVFGCSGYLPWTVLMSEGLMGDWPRDGVRVIGGRKGGVGRRRARGAEERGGRGRARMGGGGRRQGYACGFLSV